MVVTSWTHDRTKPSAYKNAMQNRIWYSWARDEEEVYKLTVEHYSALVDWAMISIVFKEVEMWHTA